MMGGGFFGILIIGLVIYLVMKNSEDRTYNRGYNHTKTPLDILKERYAKGEISEEEYLEKKKTLMD